MAGRRAQRIDVADDGGDAFAELVEAGRRDPPSQDFGGAALERRPVSQQVADRILDMIRSGHLRSGDRLPTEAQMGLAFGISRPPLREALKALTLMGVIESRQGGRHTVTDLSPARLAVQLNIMLAGSDYDVSEHFAARLVVELALVEACAARASAEQRRRIYRHAVDGAALVDDPVAFRLVDNAFHHALYEGAGNRLLATLAHGLYDIGIDLRRVASTKRADIETSVRQHVEVADAVLAHDPVAAVAAYRRHLEHVRDTSVAAMAGKNDS